ncbi:MAG: zinc ribbon domain-containing protein [Actinobacteria bacterium]|nr:zinc ribbon domain-containing protein [Actinomycetota bacterium]
MQQLNPGQVKKYLKQLRERKDQYLYYLGELAFQAGEQGALGEGPMLDAYRTLKDIMVQINQWEEYMERMRAAKEAAQQPRCPRCGAGVVRGAAFCPSCGTPLGAAAPAAPGMPPQVAVPPQVLPQAGPLPPGAAPGPYGAPAPAAPGIQPPSPQPSPQPPPPPPAPAGAVVPGGKACAVCGAALDEDALFCGNCGSRVKAGAAAPEEGAAAGGEGTGPEAVEPGTEERPSGEAVAAGGTEAVVPAGAVPLTCPGCNTAVEDAEALFCPNCGARLR